MLLYQQQPLTCSILISNTCFCVIKGGDLFSFDFDIKYVLDFEGLAFGVDWILLEKNVEVILLDFVCELVTIVELW